MKRHRERETHKYEKMERPIIYCDRCKNLTIIHYDTVYRDGQLIGELVRHWCDKCQRNVRTRQQEILKEYRGNGNNII